MNYQIKAGVLYKAEDQRKLAWIKPNLYGQEKKIYAPDDTLLATAGVCRMDDTDPNDEDVRTKEYVLLGADGGRYAVGRPQYAEERIPRKQGGRSAGCPGSTMRHCGLTAPTMSCGWITSRITAWWMPVAGPACRSCTGDWPEAGRYGHGGLCRRRFCADSLFFAGTWKRKTSSLWCERKRRSGVQTPLATRPNLCYNTRYTARTPPGRGNNSLPGGVLFLPCRVRNRNNHSCRLGGYRHGKAAPLRYH